MKFELKEFQEDAARQLLDDMTDLMGSYVRRKKPASCCLAAPTGSGKTVIAAAVIEELVGGSQDLGVDAFDGDACVLWVTDLPSLAEQTRERLLEATDLDESLIESVTNTFSRDHDVLEAGKVYFLHRQLLGKGKLLTRGGESRTFWQVLRDSIESGLHLYMFLDEAHRGIGSEAKKIQGDETIYAQLIDGFDGATPVPVVVGISATPKRFLDAMSDRTGRTSESPVRVVPADVQASGLLKDDILLMSPQQRSAAEEMYLGDACKALRDSTKLWSNWCAANGVQEVRPLMVVQVEDNVSDARIQELCREIQEKVPELGTDAFAHVIGDHVDRNLRGFYVPYLSPEDVERHGEVRVLFAKEAISTGWDCPRAEVLYSMRKHSDTTYIAQLLGRMVRTPLARSVDVATLNAVSCYLPLFDGKAVKEVKAYLTDESSDDWAGVSEESGRHVYNVRFDVSWNHDLGVDDAFRSIVKRIESHHPTNVILAAFEYASLLAQYEMDSAAPKAMEKDLLDELKDDIDSYKTDFELALQSASKIVSVQVHLQYLNPEAGATSTLTQDADAFAVAHARERADHVFTQALTNAYFRSEHGRHMSDRDINIRIAAAATTEKIVDAVNERARERLEWLTKGYGSLVEESAEPIRTAFASVLSRNGIHRDENLRIIETDIQEGLDPVFRRHVLSDPETREAHLHLNETEKAVVALELERGCVAFYRNPSGGMGEHVLSVVYLRPTGGHKNFHPDFVFFEKVGDKVMPSIVDPHGEQYSDAIPKMRGLCDYVEEFGSLFERVWSVDGEAERYADIKDPAVREYIRREDVMSAEQVFRDVGKDYR